MVQLCLVQAPSAFRIAGEVSDFPFHSFEIKAMTSDATEILVTTA